MAALLQFFTRNTYRQTLTWVIGLKLVGLTLIWALFFSTPVTVTTDKIERHLMAEDEKPIGNNLPR